METKDRIIELLEEIQTWMVENDYECGPQGSQIYSWIEDELKELKTPRSPIMDHFKEILKDEKGMKEAAVIAKEIVARAMVKAEERIKEFDRPKDTP